MATDSVKQIGVDSLNCEAANLCESEEILQRTFQTKIKNINNENPKIETELIGKVSQTKEETLKTGNSTSPMKNKNPKRIKRFPEKTFKIQDSLLTELLKINHFRTIYNIFIVILIVMSLTTIFHDYAEFGKINLGLYPIRRGFGNIWTAFGIWIGMQLMVFSLFFFYKIWASSKLTRSSKNNIRTIWNRFWIFLFVSYQLIFGVLTVKAILTLNIRPASTLALMSELARLIMKNHAFVRTNAQNAGSPKEKPENRALPSLASFTYFQFAPTLIYRDNYPRTEKIRWGFVASNVLDVIATVFTISFIFERFLMPNFQDIGRTEVTLAQVILAICSCILPGALTFLCGFYVLLHCWMNIFGELLRFADRMFYSDWWNCNSLDEYYRSWNVIVHDWLFNYVYKDLYEHVFVGSNTVATLFVFTLSAVVHEIILSVTFRFFYPVMFVIFMIASFPMALKKRRPKMLGNISMWISFVIGNGLILGLYGMEYFARQNCPGDGTFWSYIGPVSWSCLDIVDNKN